MRLEESCSRRHLFEDCDPSTKPSSDDMPNMPGAAVVSKHVLGIVAQCHSAILHTLMRLRVEVALALHVAVIMVLIDRKH